MVSKTFNIGECSRHGVITVEITSKTVKILLREWDNSKGFTKNSNQTKSKVVETFEVNLDDRKIIWKLSEFLCEDTTSYYSDVIITWICSKTNIPKNIWI